MAEPILSAADLPATTIIPSAYERVELEDLGIEILVPLAYLRMLRKLGKPLELRVELEAEVDISPPPPLTSDQQSLLDYLRENGVTSSTELARVMGYNEKTIKRWCGKSGILREYGVQSTSTGYGVAEQGH